LAAATLGVSDRLLGRQRRALGPRGVKVLLSHSVPQRRHRGLVAGVPNLEPHRAHTLPDARCRTEEPGGFAVTVVLAGQSGEAFEDVRDEQVRLDFGGTRERVLGVALGLLRLTRRDRHAGAGRQPPRQPRPMPESRSVDAHRFLAVTSRYSHPITPSRRCCSASSTSWASSVAAST
jgi:hypothetical protein